MSKIHRCNRCAAEVTLPDLKSGNNSGSQVLSVLGTVSALKGWAEIQLVRRGALFQPATKVLDLCGDCVEILLEQFMVGAAVAPITTPLERTVLPHPPMLDCQLIWNPGKGRLLCRHDDPELFDSLVVDQDKITSDIQDAVHRMAKDVETTAAVQSRVHRCGPECTEAHTYEGACLLSGVCSIPPQRQPEPPADEDEGVQEPGDGDE